MRHKVNPRGISIIFVWLNTTTFRLVSNIRNYYTGMSVSMKTKSGSLIPGTGSYLLTSDGILDKSNTLSFLVRKETICSKLVSWIKSRNKLFTDVGKLWLSTICVVHWMSDRLMSPPLQKTAPLLFLFNCPLVA